MFNKEEVSILHYFRIINLITKTIFKKEDFSKKEDLRARIQERAVFPYKLALVNIKS
jgi:hypothetical protein